MDEKVCSECGGPFYARGVCHRCYDKRRRRGEMPAVVAVLRFPESLLQRMEPQPNGCIHFTGALDPEGFGGIMVKYRQMKAHRLAYEHFVGPIPARMEVGHTCHDGDESCTDLRSCLHRRCVNPEHLYLRTHWETMALYREAVGITSSTKLPADLGSTRRGTGGALAPRT